VIIIKGKASVSKPRFSNVANLALKYAIVTLAIAEFSSGQLWRASTEKTSIILYFWHVIYPVFAPFPPLASIQQASSRHFAGIRPKSRRALKYARSKNPCKRGFSAWLSIGSDAAN
jgi:hypothetical protein